MSTLQQRIAALQQQRATPSPTPNPTPLPTNSLRDKIARFEKKGGLPVPARRAGDLYANRLSPKPQLLSEELHVKGTKYPLENAGIELPVKAHEQTLLSQLKVDKQISIPLSQSQVDEQISIPLPQSETNEQTFTPLSQSQVDEQISIPLPQSETNEQTFTPLSQFKVNEKILSEANEQALVPLPHLANEQTPTLSHDEKISILSETNEQTLTPLPQSETNEQTPTSLSHDEQTLTPLPQQTLTPLSKAHEQTLTLLTKAHEQTPTPLPQSESTKELQSLPTLAVNDQDQTPSSPTTPHAPTFNLSSTLKGGPLAAIPPEHLAPSNVHRPLSMLPISISANPSLSLAKMSTPIQDIDYDRDAKATDHDRPTVRDEPEIQTQPESRLGNEPGSTSSSNFRAIIHHKVAEPPHRPPEPSLPQSKTPVRRAASAAPLSTGTSLDLELLSSPMFGDLTDLLQSTVLLQERLEQTVIPVSSSETTIANSGVPVIVTDQDHDDGAELHSHLEVRRLSKEEVEENKRTLSKLQAKREEQARSKVRNGFFGPFGRASKDVPREAPKGVSIDGAAAPSQQQQLYSKRSKSPSVLNSPKDIKPSSDAPGADIFHSKTLENQSTGSGSGKPSSLSQKSPPKSPKSGLSAFRLLTSRSSPSSAQDCRHGRNSVSTSSEFSSEDSAPSAVTPPDGANEFGGLRSWLNMGSPQSKKGGDGLSHGEERDKHVSRAVTFAGKIWQRARTRSGASTRSAQSLRGRRSRDPPPTLPPLPDNVMASDGQAGEDVLGPLPTRKTPLLPRSPSPSLPPFDLDPSRSPTHRGLQTYRPHSPSAHSFLSESPSSLSVGYRSRSDLGSTPSSPGQGSAKRRSWTSSSHYANSSVLDIDLFDAFPSVPENQPLVFLPPCLPSPSLSHQQQQQQQPTYSLRSNSAVSLTSSVVSGPSHMSLVNRGMNGRGGTALLSPAVELSGSREYGKASAYLSPKLDVE